MNLRKTICLLIFISLLQFVFSEDAKSQEFTDEKAQQIKKMALSAQKLVVESPEDARAIFREFNEGDSFDKYNSALIDIMEEFRLIETGSFHRV